jgi:hypothetical protein
LRNICHDAADDVTPYVLLLFFATCVIASAVLSVLAFIGVI